MKMTTALLTLVALCMAATSALAMSNTATIQINIPAPAAPTLASNNPAGSNVGTYYVNEQIVLTANSADASSYVWYKDGVPIANENGNTLTIASAAARDNGVYTAVAVNNCEDKSVASNPINIAVYNRVEVTITANPEAIEGNHTPCINITLTANVPSNTYGPLTYQWSLNGTPIPGATSATYQINSPTSAESGNYSVQVTDAMGRDPMAP